MTISTWAIALASAASLAAQGSNDKTLRGTVTIKSEGGSVAIHGKAAPPLGEFLFCVDQDRASAKRIEFTGPARVLYRYVPIAGIPAGMTISGPESVANTLAVIADDGEAWRFVATGGRQVLAAGDRAEATTGDVTGVRRRGCVAGSRPRRGAEVA